LTDTQQYQVDWMKFTINPVERPLNYVSIKHSKRPFQQAMNHFRDDLHLLTGANLQSTQLIGWTWFKVCANTI